jgi:N-acetylmuramoyl-L-alanine amidase
LAFYIKSLANCGKLTVLAGALLLSSCATNPYSKTNKLYKANAKAMAKQLQAPLDKPYQPNTGMDPAVEDWVGSYHFNLRKPTYIMIHHTAQNSLAQTIRTFTVDQSQVSSHYVIGRDGTVVQMVNDYLRAWHAGAGKWATITDLNAVTIGIELDNNGFEPFPEEQINSLMVLLDTLKKRHRIPTANFLAHSDTAPTRKQDPSALFPWKKLAENGFGIWPDEQLVTPPDTFNPYDALRIIGYDLTNLEAAVVAFKRRYIQHELSPQLTLETLQVLYNLYHKY